MFWWSWPKSLYGIVLTYFWYYKKFWMINNASLNTYKWKRSFYIADTIVLGYKIWWSSMIFQQNMKRWQPLWKINENKCSLTNWVQLYAYQTWREHASISWSQNMTRLVSNGIKMHTEYSVLPRFINQPN